MIRLFPIFGLVAALLVSAGRVCGFAVLGQQEEWMRAELTYFTDDDSDGVIDIGGPKNLGDEYRWHSPVFTYALDLGFVNYFGSEGIRAVDAAFQILNNLPPASQMSELLSEFPNDTRRFNGTASALGVADLKTFVLSYALSSLGVGAAERWVYTLRDRFVRDTTPFYTVIQRNFDPVTLNPSLYVNGQLYSYSVQQVSTDPDRWDATERPVLPGIPSFSTVASFMNGHQGLPDGVFVTGLTREDVGAWRYLYSPYNYNYTILPTNILSSLRPLSENPEITTNSPGVFIDPNSLLSIVTSAWDLPGSILFFGGSNNISSTNLNFNGPAWGLPGNIAFFTNGTPGTGGGSTDGSVIGPNSVDGNSGKVRGGIDKIVFVRVPYDSVVGVIPGIPNVRYQDRFVVNGQIRTQTVQRVISVPDLLISAADIGTRDGVPIRSFINEDASRWDNYLRNYYSTNTLVSPPLTGLESVVGPGSVQTPIFLTINKLGAFTIQREGPGGGALPATWGWFDGSTNPPVVFPVGSSLRDLEITVPQNP